MRVAGHVIRLTRLGKLTLAGGMLALGISLSLTFPLLMHAKVRSCGRVSHHKPRLASVDVAIPGAGRVRFEGQFVQWVERGRDSVTMRWRNGFSLEVLGDGECGRIHADYRRPGQDAAERVELVGGRIYRLERGVESWRPLPSALSPVGAGDRSASDPLR